MSNTSIDLFYNLYKKHQDDDVDKNPLKTK